MNKKIVLVLISVFALSFSTQVFASLTFTDSAIVGTTASGIDLGSGNTLSLQTIGNAPITTGTGLFTAAGGISSTLFTGPVTALKSATTSVNVSAATAPTVGQILTATSGTAATWQTDKVFENFSNLSVGSSALNRTTPGFSNVAIGQSALFSVTNSSDSNTAVGSAALKYDTSGSYNTGMGEEALFTNTTGNSNSAFGFMALYLNNTTSFNTAMGHQSLKNTTGASNTAIGYRSLYHNTTGTFNVAIGQQAGETTTSANNNLTGSNNTWVGYNTGPSVDGTSSPLSNASAFGNGAMNSISNQISLGNSSVTQLVLGAGPIWAKGTGSPEGVVTATVGSFYSRTDGGANTSWYVKESGSGNTGWIAK